MQDTRTDEIITQMISTKEKAKNVDEQIYEAQQKLIKMNEKNTVNFRCMICYTDKEELFTSRCGHLGCKNCFQSVIQDVKECPMC